MLKFQNIIFLFTLVATFASCTLWSDPNSVLLVTEKRKNIITTIANNNEMMQEMMAEITNNNNAKLMVQKNEAFLKVILEDRDTMMKIMKDNPAMMQFMMADMVEAANGDSSLMTKICETMMDNQPMVDMMQQMHGGKK